MSTMQDDLRILFTGDLSITGVYREQVTLGKEIFDQRLLDLFARHDFTVVNLEGPTSSAKNVSRSDVNVVSPPETVAYLVSRGIKVFNCANNHIFDCGIDGFVDTVRAIDKSDGQYFGAGADISQASRPLILSGGGIAVALLGVCNHKTFVATETDFGTFYDAHFAAVKRAIDNARAEADYVILNYHAGEEYTAVPMPSRRRMMLKYASLDADAIVGHHSHVMQGRERQGNCEIFYSLGNFVFDVPILRTKQLTDSSALLSATFTTDRFTFELIPIVNDRKRGLVVPGSPCFLNHIGRISNFANYRALWRQDAYRTMFQSRRVSETAPPAGNRVQSLVRRHRWLNTLRPNWYVFQLRRLSNSNQRPIMLAAWHEAIRKFFRRLLHTQPL